VLSRSNVWVPGLVIGAVLAFVIRPLLVGLCLIPARLAANERGFVLLSGLKGAVPILLGVTLLSAHISGATRLYGIVVVVVAFSVIVQGSLVPVLADVLRLPMRGSELEPWTVGVRLRHEPEGVHRLRVVAGAAVVGQAVADLPVEVWVSSVVRVGHLVRVHEGTRLRAGDEVVVFADPEQSERLRQAFEREASEGPEIS
jgi:cell volume regulation protein A